MDDATKLLTLALAGRYRLEGSLGEGGMAVVYRAHDLKHDRPVALKVLRPELTGAIGNERFLREIRLTARLDHPHILPLLDSGEAEGFLYYVMPYVEGETLRERLGRERQLSLDEALQIAREVADALSYAHSHGVVHRDIKPENILLAGGHARVADFGIARAVTAAGGDGLTQTGLVVGTPAYMSPEQAGGERELDGRSDVYALGCVAYEMLAGHPPFTGASAQEVLARHSLDAVPRLSAARPSVPRDIEEAIATALAKVPADRFRTAALFAESLTGGGTGTERRRTVAPARAGWGLAAIGTAVVLVVAGTVLIRQSMTAPGPAYERTAIAVLPFQNLSPVPDHAYFAGALQDELLTQLSKVSALRVISRNSVADYEGASLQEIASDLGVGSAVRASVQVAGDRLRVTVQLLDAATGALLWAERYDRTLDDAFAIQTDVARRVVASVGATLGTSERLAMDIPPTAHSEAYRLYLQGKEYFRRPGRMRENLLAARQLFEQAVVLDSTFAVARAALSQTYGWIHWYGHADFPDEIRQRQWEEANAARRLAHDAPEAHVAMGMAHYLARLDYRRALEELQRAVPRLPDAELWNIIGAVHRRMGNWSAVESAFVKATALDPRNAQYFFNLGGITLMHVRRYAEAVRAFDHALRLAPDLHAAAAEKGVAYVVWRGELDTLRAVLRRIPRDVSDMPNFGSATSLALQLLLWERKPDSLLKVLATAPAHLATYRAPLRTAPLFAAYAHVLRGDAPAAAAAFTAALAAADSTIHRLPDSRSYLATVAHGARGLALAGLGRRQEALQEAQWLRESPTYREDALGGALVAEERARILAQTGEADAALDEIERLLAGPSRWLSVHTLRLDPLWDPVREHRRFRALVARHGGS